MITLHLGKEFQKLGFRESYTYNAKKPVEMIRAIDANTKKTFRRALINMTSAYRFVRGKDLNDESKALNHITMNYEYPDNDFYLVPVPEGGGDDGWVTIIVAVVLIAATWWAGGVGGWFSGFTYGAEMYSACMYVGVALLLTGVSQLMTPEINPVESREDPNEKRSYIYNGPTNTVEQGGPIPIVYGRMLVGSTVISSAIEVEGN